MKNVVLALFALFGGCFGGVDSDVTPYSSGTGSSSVVMPVDQHGILLPIEPFTITTRWNVIPDVVVPADAVLDHSIVFSMPRDQRVEAVCVVEVTVAKNDVLISDAKSTVSCLPDGVLCQIEITWIEKAGVLPAEYQAAVTVRDSERLVIGNAHYVMKLRMGDEVTTVIDQPRLALASIAR